MKKSFWTELWFLLVCTFAGIALLAIVVPVASVFFLDSLSLVSTLMLHILQWAQTVFVMIIPPLFWYKWRMKRNPFADFGFLRTDWRVMALAFLFIVCSVPAFDLINYINIKLIPPVFREMAERMSAENFAVIEKMMAVGGIGGWTELILLMSIGTAIGEELMFRGALYKCFCLTKLNKHWIAIFVGLVFSVIHFEPLGFLTRWILGSVLCYLVIWSQSIWPAVVMHATNNLIATIQYKFLEMDLLSDSVELTFGWGLTLLSVVVSVFLIVFIRNNKRVEFEEIIAL